MDDITGFFEFLILVDAGDIEGLKTFKNSVHTIRYQNFTFIPDGTNDKHPSRAKQEWVPMLEHSLEFRQTLGFNQNLI